MRRPLRPWRAWRAALAGLGRLCLDRPCLAPGRRFGRPAALAAALGLRPAFRAGTGPERGVGQRPPDRRRRPRRSRPCRRPSAAPPCRGNRPPAARSGPDRRQAAASAPPDCRRRAAARRALASARPGSRSARTRMSSSTLSSITASSRSPFSASIRSSASACGTVRGKPSRMKPLLGVGLVDAVGDDRDHDLVGHQLAARHDVLGLEADRRAGRHRRAQHVAGRELHDAVLGNELLAPACPCRPPAGRAVSILIAGAPAASTA